MREIDMFNMAVIVDMGDPTGRPLLVCNRKDASYIQQALEFAHPGEHFATFTAFDDLSNDLSNHEDMVYSVIG